MPSSRHREAQPGAQPEAPRRPPAASSLLLAALILTAASFPHALAQSGWWEHEQQDEQEQQQYNFVLLHAPFPGVDQTLGFGVNDFGTVVGVYHDAAGPHGFVLDDGAYTPINVTLNGVVQQNTQAFGINQRRDIVGSYGPTGTLHGFVLEDGVFTTLDFPGANATQTEARGINDRRQIVGTYHDAAGSHGFLFEQEGREHQGGDEDSRQSEAKHSGQYTAIDVPFTGASNTTALGINDRGDIVGAYVSSDARIHGFVRRHGEFQTLDVPFRGVVETQAYGINNRREIVGTGFLLDHKTFTPLANLNPSAANAVATGINDRGEIVGITLGSPEVGFQLIPQ
ncbi:MAG TPA: hypothetical protein VNW54_08850 [Granulicella sp.]|nr:hypothetical protein [Granulicella sp.]